MAKITLILFAVRGEKMAFVTIATKKYLFHYLGYPIYDFNEYDRVLIKFY